MSRRVALVTGSTSGIGLGIARALADAGYDVMLHGFGDDDVIAGIRAELERRGARVAYSKADIRACDEIDAMVAACVRELGGLDVLVNNAGVQRTVRVEAATEDDWNNVININLTGPFHTSRYALPHMQARRWGRIVNIASAHGLVGSSEKAPYVAAKHGLVGLTKVLALENANSGITANAICPGWVRTPLVEAQIAARAEKNGTTVEQEAVALLAEKQPMHKFTTPEQIGALVVFLCSDAAETITGSVQSIDGGWTAQ